MIDYRIGCVCTYCGIDEVQSGGVWVITHHLGRGRGSLGTDVTSTAKTTTGAVRQADNGAWEHLSLANDIADNCIFMVSLCYRISRQDIDASFQTRCPADSSGLSDRGPSRKKHSTHPLTRRNLTYRNHKNFRSTDSKSIIRVQYLLGKVFSNPRCNNFHYT